LAKAKQKAHGIACLNNTKQLVLGYIMYQGDASEMLMRYDEWVGKKNGLDWLNNDDNTNSIYLIGTNKMAAYIKSVGSYKCPGDQRAAQNGPRLRSVSMFQTVGAGGNSASQLVNGNGLTYVSASKASQLNIPGPVNCLVFTDEHGDGINDGTFACKYGEPKTAEQWQDLPANYHNGCSSFSFADGHGEIHKWLDGRTFSFPVTGTAATPWNGAVLTGGSVDYEWVMQRAPHL
jgi:hypothetical protein